MCTSPTGANGIALDGQKVADTVLKLEVRTVRMDSPGRRPAVAAKRVDLAVWFDAQVTPRVHVVKVDLLAFDCDDVINTAHVSINRRPQATASRGH